MHQYNIIEKNNQQYLHFENHQSSHYVIMMQIENTIQSLVKVVKDIDCTILYEVTDLVSIKEYFTEKGATIANITFFMECINRTKKDLSEYLINENQLIFNEKLIFTNNNFSQVYFMVSDCCDHEQESLTKIFKYIIGNYFYTANIKEIRLREELLKFLKEHIYNDKQIKNIICEIEAVTISKGSEEHKKDLLDISTIFNKIFVNKTQNNSTCEVRNIDGFVSLTNICDVTKKIFLDNDELVINRTMLSKQFNICNKKIGRVHARVYIDGGQIYLFDLGSKNGTYINGERIDKKTPFPVEKGDIVSFADEEFIIC